MRTTARMRQNNSTRFEISRSSFRSSGIFVAINCSLWLLLLPLISLWASYPTYAAKAYLDNFVKTFLKISMFDFDRSELLKRKSLNVLPSRQRLKVVIQMATLQKCQSAFDSRYCKYFGK